MIRSNVILFPPTDVRLEQTLDFYFIVYNTFSWERSISSTTRQLSGAHIFRGILSQNVTSSGSSPGAGMIFVVLHSVSKNVSQTTLDPVAPEDLEYLANS